MSTSYTSKKSSQKISLLTPRVRAAQYELISALKESVEESGLDRGQAEGKLSKVMAEIWNEAETITRRMPGIEAYVRGKS